MPYAIRDKEGNLTGTTKNPTSDEAERIEFADPEYLQLVKTRQHKQNVEAAIQNQMRLIAIQQMKSDRKIDMGHEEPVITNVSSGMGR